MGDYYCFHQNIKNCSYAIFERDRKLLKSKAIWSARCQNNFEAWRVNTDYIFSNTNDLIAWSANYTFSVVADFLFLVFSALNFPLFLMSFSSYVSYRANTKSRIPSLHYLQFDRIAITVDTFFLGIKMAKSFRRLYSGTGLTNRICEWRMYCTTLGVSNFILFSKVYWNAIHTPSRFGKIIWFTRIRSLHYISGHFCCSIRHLPECWNHDSL